MTEPGPPGGRHAGADHWTGAAAISDNTVPDDTVQQATVQPATVGTADGASDTEPLAASFDIDLRQRNVYIGGRSVALTAKEYLLIELLFTSRGRLFGRDDILERVWGLDFFGEERIVDAYVRRLRSKLGAVAVETVRGLGYRCPLPETAGVAQPNLQRLPPEARLLTRLAQRILQVTDPAHIIADVYELLREHYGMQGVTLWELPQDTVSTRGALSTQDTLLAHAGLISAPSVSPQHLQESVPGRHDLALVPLGTGTADAGPWALLAFWGSGQDGWPLEVRSALDAVAGLVNPALRLNSEIRRREQAEREVRTLNLDLERRVQARTQALARANADLGALYELAQELAGAQSLEEVLAQGLSILAGLAGASVCSLWRLRTAELTCLGANTPGHQDLRSELQGQSASLASLLRQSVACTSAQSVLTRTASLPDGRQVLLIPVASGLPEVHALYLELPGELPADLSLLDAAVRAFGLAFERQTQTLMIEQAALSDELTGLPNRRALLGDLTAELSYSQRHRTSLTLSLFEIPDIREVNLRLGFAGGNDLIQALVGELRGTLRLEDRMYRLGGAVLATLVRSVDPQEGQAIVQRLDALGLRFLGDRLALPGHGLLQVSHASAPDESVELSDLLGLALERLESGHAQAEPSGAEQIGPEQEDTDQAGPAGYPTASPTNETVLPANDTVLPTGDTVPPAPSDTVLPIPGDPDGMLGQTPSADPSTGDPTP